MNIKKIIAGTATVATMLLSATPALAANLGAGYLYGPVSSFGSCEAGGVATDQTFGRVILNRKLDDGILKATIVFKRALPNTQYTIYLNQYAGDCPTTPSATFTTNRHGNGSVRVTESLAQGATNFWVSAVGGNQVLRSTAMELSSSLDDQQETVR